MYATNSREARKSYQPAINEDTVTKKKQRRDYSNGDAYQIKRSVLGKGLGIADRSKSVVYWNRLLQSNLSILTVDSFLFLFKLFILHFNVITLTKSQILILFEFLLHFLCTLLDLFCFYFLLNNLHFFTLRFFNCFLCFNLILWQFTLQEQHRFNDHVNCSFHWIS